MLCALRQADTVLMSGPSSPKLTGSGYCFSAAPLASTRFLLATRGVQEKAVWGPSFGWAGPETSRRAALHHPTFLTVRIIVSALSRTSSQCETAKQIPGAFRMRKLRHRAGKILFKGQTLNVWGSTGPPL